MPTNTSFLNLTLPELNEFVDSWNAPLNANFETVDDFLDDLYRSLETGSAPATSTWSSLKGSAASLAARLNVSIKADGTLDVSGSADILAISVSAVHGTYNDSPRDRLNAGDFEIYDARQPVAGGRFTPIPAVGPSAGYPPEQIDSGIALRAAEFGGDANHPISSPRIPWAPGLVTGGAVPMLVAQAGGTVRLNADTIPAIFNIDGYAFRIRETLDFDWGLLAPADNVYVWIYVERDSTNYLIGDGINFKYDGVGGAGTGVKDLRKLQSGSVGNTSGNIFLDTGALFDTAVLGKVKAGDIMVITAPASAAGEYVIDELDGTTPDTKLTIKGTFNADISGATWYVLDDSHPNIGAVATDADPTTQPPFAPGRVYIGRAKHRTGATLPEEVITFTRGGVHDSGWVGVDAGADFPRTIVHNLGQQPSQVEIWVRTSATGRAYQPIVERQIVTKALEANFPNPVAGDNSTTLKMLFPSMRSHMSNTDITVQLINTTLDPAKGPSLFTDSSSVEQAIGQIRVISRL